MTNNKKLEWNVYLYDPNSNAFENFNVFNSSRFYDGLPRIKKEMKKNLMTFEQFDKELNARAMYSFWAKSEYEIILANIFCTISKDEIDRIKKVDTNKRVESVNLLHEKKIDIYNQLLLNWNKFSEYVYNNIKAV